MTEAFYTTDDQDYIEQVIGHRVDESYDVLIGPDDFDCILTEPEDRRWTRDGKYVVKLLNSQYDEIKRLKRVVKKLKKGKRKDKEAITYEWICGLVNAYYTPSGCDIVQFVNVNKRIVSFYFNPDGTINSTFYAGTKMTNPTTRSEVMTILKICMVDIENEHPENYDMNY